MELKGEVEIQAPAKIDAPLEWFSPDICKIIDLKEETYDEVIRLIKVEIFHSNNSKFFFNGKYI